MKTAYTILIYVQEETGIKTSKSLLACLLALKNKLREFCREKFCINRFIMENYSLMMFSSLGEGMEDYGYFLHKVHLLS